ncbi:transcriptional repressor [Porphyromonas phage phage007a_Bg4]|uniref:S24 family peptidase n=1 Tax=Porphyromonas gingivalis TaxID=837 RepID=UPI00248043F8|nr:S24 family peptidase [Porphyromonas gingivalis]MDH7902920.1 S24 family peptidase [Porphyromonas gingivalis]
MEENCFSLRLEYAISHLTNGNKSLFAKELSTSESNIRGYLAGVQPKIDFLQKIIAKFAISPEWLLTGQGDMLKSDMVVAQGPVEYKVIHHPKYTEAVRDQQVVYLYDIEATAGLRAIMDNKSQNIIDTIRIPNLPKCDGAIHVVGDSMYPILKSGDIVLYKEVTDLSNIFWGEMYLLSIAVDDEEYITVKYLQRSDEGKDYVRLVSHNQHHSPKDIPTSSITALALVKASIRLNTIR